MNLLYAFFSVMIFFINTGCKDVPYQDPVPIPKATQLKYNFNGVVSLGSPVTNTSIIAFEFSGLKKGPKLSEATSDQLGEFEFSFFSSYQGPILIEAQGGLFKDLITGEDVVLDKAYPLSSAIAHTEVLSRTNINAWTTIAVARVKAKKGFWDTRAKDLSDKKRIEEDFAALSHFLSKEGSLR